MYRVFSGGAKGSDLAWGTAAREVGWRPVHFSFEGHKTQADPAELFILSQEQLRSGNKRLVIASQALKRKWPPKFDYTRKMLQRNWWQVRDTGSVYAVSTIEAGTSSVASGTGWAVQMYVDLHVPGKVLRLYLYDQVRRCWFQYTGDGYHADTKVVNWSQIEAPPKPEGDFTGIGARDLFPHGEAAIYEVFR